MDRSSEMEPEFLEDCRLDETEGASGGMVVSHLAL